jgi:hypothetical protein
MNNQLRTLGIAALLAQSLVFFACSSAGTTGTGGSTGTAGGNGSGGTTGGLGGMTAAGGSTGGQCLAHPGSCTCAADNPDSVAGGACASDCQSVSCGKPCRENCCVPCGIDAAGTKTCTCTMPGQPYTNCTCSPPTGFPTGLSGGLCSPQGYAATTPPAGAPAGSISIKGAACTMENAVCFTADSMPSSERGCICMGGILHCGSVNHWFTNSGALATPY